MTWKHYMMASCVISGVASHWGGKGGQSATPDSEKLAKNREKEGKNQEKSENIGRKRGNIGKKSQKSGKKRKNREVYFTLPLLTDRAGYATVCNQ